MNLSEDFNKTLAQLVEGEWERITYCTYSKSHVYLNLGPHHIHEVYQ